MDCPPHSEVRRSSLFFPGPPVSVSLANFDMEALSQPSPSQVEAYELYLHLSELTTLWQTPTVSPAWRNEPLVKPALHSLELVFRLISGVLCDTRPYIDREEWIRRLESLACSQLEVLSLVVEGDEDAPIANACASFVGNESVVWHKSGSKPVVSRLSKESLLPRLASWRTAQNVSTRLQFAIEGQMARAPFTLGLGEPNLSGKPVLEYDLICQPLEVYACRQSLPGHPEDHTLSTVHQMLEAWLEVAAGLLRSVEENVQAANFEGAAKSCWVLERVWKLLIATLDLLQIMDPDDFMRLKEELAISQDGTAVSTEHIGGGAYCLRSTRLRQVTKDCKELRHLLPKVVGVEADPKGGPRLQEAVMNLLHSHGMRTHVQPPFHRPFAFHSSTIHLLQAFQAVEAAVRQFYFAYQQLVISVMGSGEYKATATASTSAADALSQIYFEPPYFPSLDGAKTFLGSYWHHHPELEEGAIMRQLMVEKSVRGGGSGDSCDDGGSSTSVDNSDSGDSSKVDGDDSRSPKKSASSIDKQQFANAARAYSSNHHMYQGAMGA